MKIKKLMGLFSKKHTESSPLIIIKKNTSADNIKEYESIEEAILDLENDPNVSVEKIEKLRSSLNTLKNKTSIRIKNGELIK